MAEWIIAISMWCSGQASHSNNGLISNREISACKVKIFECYLKTVRPTQCFLDNPPPK